MYPEHAGWKATETSRTAAETTDAKSLRERVWRWVLEHGPATPDETADALGLSMLSVRPRFSELRRLGQIVDTGHRGTNASGKRAMVWRALPPDRLF